MFVRPSKSSPTLQEYQLFQSASRSSGHLAQASGHQNPMYPEINCVNQSPQSHEGLAGVRGQPGCDLSTSAPPLCLPVALTLPGSPCFRATVCPRAWALRASAQASEVIPGWDFFLLFCFASIPATANHEFCWFSVQSNQNLPASTALLAEPLYSTLHWSPG